MIKSKNKILNWAFDIFCTIMAIYMSSLQVGRYFRNEDTSSYATKEFNQTPLDLYPSFSYCFVDEKGGLYNKQSFTDINWLTREEYLKVLMGKTESRDNESDIERLNTLEIDADTLTLNQDHIFQWLESDFSNHSEELSTTLGGSYGSFMDSSVMYKSYQDPVKMCFTRKSVFQKGIARTSDRLQTKEAKQLVALLNKKTRVLFYIHQDGELTRAFKKGASVLLFPQKILEGNQYISLIEHFKSIPHTETTGR